METIHKVIDYTFYIEWNENGSVGMDQYGETWLNHKTPILRDEDNINALLDAINNK